MSLPPYPKYKPSGLEWLGDVPDHWDVDRLKWTTTRTINGIWGDEPNGIDDLTCVRVADFDRERFLVVDEPPTVRAVGETQRSGRILQRGDLLIEKSGGGDKQLVGCVVLFDHQYEAVCSNFVARMPRRSRHVPRFWAYAHAALYAGRLNYPAIKQTTGIQNLDSAVYLDTRVGYPPDHEQRTIADFLDRETAKIDTLVTKKRTLIERLKEKRAALISRTITRGLPPAAAGAAGLDPHPKLRPSGIDWLGDVPAHWELKPLKSLARIGNGSTPSRDNGAYWEGGSFPWLNSSAVNQEAVTEADEYVSELALAECHLPRVLPPAVLVGITGQGRTRGMATTLLIEATINQHLAFVKPADDRVDVGFIRRAIDAAYVFLRSESDGGGSTKGAITCGQIAGLRMAVPSLPEQRAIVDFLDHETAKVDGMVAKVDAAIERLKEYRVALITAAVTGKIDVRGIGERHATAAKAESARMEA